MTRLSVAIILLLAASPFAAAQERPSVRPEPGLWKVLLKFTQNGKPMSDKTESICYAAAQFDDLVATFATPFPDHDCTRNHTIAGKTLRLTAACKEDAPQGGTLSVTQEGSYVFEDAGRFTGSLVTTFAPPNQPVTVISTSKAAERVGPCPE
ncbi:MAG TPA: DUF3617 family protein [Xanthobacteraceae bacterium]|jgi:hypothetical protein